ncbi:hypothetical protein ABH960_003344 [Bacillus sp. RC252]
MVAISLCLLFYKIYNEIDKLQIDIIHILTKR